MAGIDKSNCLDPHSEAILEEFREQRPFLEETAAKMVSDVRKMLDENGIIVAALESRVKSEGSLIGKLRLKGQKYSSLGDLTDIIGIRVITFYVDDVDKVASGIDRMYNIDWENSVDKRKILEINSFGYLSLHYICYVPQDAYNGPEPREKGKMRFEVQMRTVLQHAWANMNHDTGYKSGVEIPREYMRTMNRLAGMLELVDDEFSRIRNELADYRRRVQRLVESGNLSEVLLDGDSFRSYLTIRPFDALNRRIASINQAEIHQVDLSVFLPLFKMMQFNTLGDIDDMVKKYSEAAYQIACFQIGLTDIDILSSSVAPQNLCAAYILKNGGGRAGIRMMLDTLNGPSASNDIMAGFLLDQAKNLPFMNQ